MRSIRSAALAAALLAAAGFAAAQTASPATGQASTTVSGQPNGTPAVGANTRQEVRNEAAAVNTTPGELNRQSAAGGQASTIGANGSPNAVPATGAETTRAAKRAEARRVHRRANNMPREAQKAAQ